MQAGLDSFSSAYNDFGLTISTKNTELMFQPTPGNECHKPRISVNGQTLQAVGPSRTLILPSSAVPTSRLTTEYPTQAAPLGD